MIYAKAVLKTQHRRLGGVAVGTGAVTVYDEIRQPTSYKGVPELYANMHDGGCKRSAIGTEVDSRIGRPSEQMQRRMSWLGDIYAPMLNLSSENMGAAFLRVIKAANAQVSHLESIGIPSQAELIDAVGEDRISRVSPDAGKPRAYVLSHDPNLSIDTSKVDGVYVDTLAANILEVRDTWRLSKTDLATAAAALISNSLATQDALLSHIPDMEAFEMYRTPGGELIVQPDAVLTPALAASKSDGAAYSY